MEYSYVDSDTGYTIMKDNQNIGYIIPLKADIEPRLIYFLRDLYLHKKYKIKPCIPLHMQYQIKRVDWNEIMRYVNKYNICYFMKQKN